LLFHKRIYSNSLDVSTFFLVSLAKQKKGFERIICTPVFDAEHNLKLTLPNILFIEF
jgi:hypothetical protein